MQYIQNRLCKHRVQLEGDEVLRIFSGVAQHPRDVNADDWRKYELEGSMILLDKETEAVFRTLKGAQFVVDAEENLLALRFDVSKSAVPLSGVPTPGDTPRRGADHLHPAQPGGDGGDEDNKSEI